ncbi:hypothetical protein LINGRAHAP2_LOCUS1064 [Linum grandiflorum]
MEGNRNLMEENRQSLEGRLDGLGQNHQQVTLQLRSLDERYESYNSRVDRRLSQVIEVVNKNRNDFDEFRNFLTSSVAQTRNRSLDDVNPITHNFNANMSIPSAFGHSSQPRQENFSSPVNNQPSPHRANHGDIPATAHVEGLNDVGMGELPSRGGNPSPTFNIPVDQPPMHGAGQPPPIPMARPYVAPANVGGGGNLGGDHIPPRAYPRPIPPQFNGQGMDPMGFMPPPGGHDVNVLRDQVAQLLTEQLGMGVRPTIPPVYRKPYPEWVDKHHPFPRGFRVPEFATFTGMGDQSTVEHVGRFTVQCGDVGDFVNLRLFGNSLTGPAFAWYVNFPSNSIQNWQQMEQIFHAQFYRSEPEVSMADLARMRQQPGESVEKFLTACKTARNR